MFFMDQKLSVPSTGQSFAARYYSFLLEVAIFVINNSSDIGPHY